MKKIYFILAAIVLTMGVAKTQNTQNVMLGDGMIGHQLPADAKAKAIHHGKHHEKTVGFWVDLDTADSFNSASMGVGYSRFLWNANMHYTLADTLGGHHNLQNAFYVLFDTLVDAYNPNGPTPYANVTNPTVFVDSLLLWCSQVNYSGIDDTLIISILGIQTHPTGLARYPDTSASPATVYYSDTIYIPATQPLNQYNALTIAPMVQLPTNVYTVKVEYWGNKLDTFSFVAGTPTFPGANLCVGYTLADSSSYRPNSFHKDVKCHRTIPLLNDSIGYNYIECNGTNGFQLGVDGIDIIENICLSSFVNIPASGCNGFFATTSPVDASCATCANGSVTSGHSSGTSPYTYSWSNGATTQNISGLLPGVYSVTITDASSCSAHSWATVMNVACTGFTVSASAVSATCTSCANGSISTTIVGGTGPFTFNWSNGQTTQNATSLLPGNYHVTVTDANNCVDTTSKVVGNTVCAGFQATLNPTSSLCGTCANGWVSCSVTSGTTPYTFAWNTSPVQTSQNATGLLPGTYNVVIHDVNGCTASCNCTAIVGNANVCSAHFLLYPDTIAHTYLIVNQSYGSGMLHYDWNWGDASFHDTIAYPSHTYAVAGNYTICLTITDAIGCSTYFCNSYYLQRNANSMVNIFVIHEATGIKQTVDPSFVSVLPNPNDGNFTLSYRITASSAVLRIMDISGRVLYSKPINGIEGKETINANLHAGIYYWELINEGTLLNKGKMAVMK